MNYISLRLRFFTSVQADNLVTNDSLEVKGILWENAFRVTVPQFEIALHSIYWQDFRRHFCWYRELSLFPILSLKS